MAREPGMMTLSTEAADSFARLTRHLHIDMTAQTAPAMTAQTAQHVATTPSLPNAFKPL